MKRIQEAEPARVVDASLNYLAPGSFINRRFMSPGAEINTGAYEPYAVKIGDGRPFKDSFTLDTHGFMLAQHKSMVTDFFDKNQLDTIYINEVIEAVKDLIGTDLVAPSGWMLRTSDMSKHPQQKVAGYSHKSGLQPMAGEPHVDLTQKSAESRARQCYEKYFPDAKPYSRFVITSFWRTFSPPPQDYPLAVCDGRSVGREEEAENTAVLVDEMPDREAMLGELPSGKDYMVATIYRYRAEHRWWYFPNMTRDEVLVFKHYDSDHGTTWRCPHTAFKDSSFPDANTRESIEVRTFAYFP